VTVVLATGCFDILHIGHVYYLQAARALGDRLIVGVTGDAYVNKGPHRPVFSEERRALMLRELRCVDEVRIYQELVPMFLIRSVRPQIYVKGQEYVGRLPEQALVESLGGRVVFTDTPVYSSTKILERVCAFS